MARVDPDLSPPARWQGIGLSDPGRVRPSNQDAFAVCNDLSVWAIADGMGGRPGGREASLIAVNTAVQELRKSAVLSGDSAYVDSVRTLLGEVATRSNQAVRDEAVRCPALMGMGTTLVILVVLPSPSPTALVAHVGDSRAYLFRDATLRRITRDHSFVEEAIHSGVLSEEEAEDHPLRHVLTRAVGTEPEVEPDISILPLEDGDILLLCTDGLTKMVTEDVIAAVLKRPTLSARARCRALIDEANRRGGEDNTTVILVSNQKGIDK
ncbi:Stp1/IreP family PP2C-type Ser/Thr phosphatase [Candidatus Nitrospira bockiana]